MSMYLVQSTIWGHFPDRIRNLEMLVFEEKEKKPVYPEKNLLDLGREPTAYDAESKKSNPNHHGGKQVLSPLRHPCSSKLA